MGLFPWRAFSWFQATARLFPFQPDIPDGGPQGQCCPAYQDGERGGLIQSRHEQGGSTDQHHAQRTEMTVPPG